MKNFILIVLVVGFGLFSIDLKAREDRPHGAIKDAKLAQKVKVKMSQLETGYFQVDKLAKTNPYDWGKIRMTLNQMSDAISEIQHVDQNNTLKKPLDQLKKDLEGLKSYTSKRNPMLFQKKQAKVYSNCFSCHEGLK